jgi:hypothetical protein
MRMFPLGRSQGSPTGSKLEAASVSEWRFLHSLTLAVPPFKPIAYRLLLKAAQASICGLVGSGQSMWKNFPRGLSVRS